MKLTVQFAVPREGLPGITQWRAWLKAAARRVDGEVAANASVTLRLVGEAEGRELNEAFRDRLGPTNVLAFPGAIVGVETPDGIALELGDIVICLPVVVHEALKQSKSLDAHLAHLAVHGFLHLLGYDHNEDGAARIMEGLERAVLVDLGIGDPYAAEGDRLQ